MNICPKKLPKTLKNWKQGNKEHGNQTAGLCLLMRVFPSRWHTLSSRTCLDTNKWDAIILFNLRSGYFWVPFSFVPKISFKLRSLSPSFLVRKESLFICCHFLILRKLFLFILQLYQDTYSPLLLFLSHISRVHPLNI